MILSEKNFEEFKRFIERGRKTQKALNDLMKKPSVWASEPHTLPEQEKPLTADEIAYIKAELDHCDKRGHDLALVKVKHVRKLLASHAR